jgi:hypothetical protein
MKFLLRLWECFGNFLPSKKLSPTEPLTRYIFNRDGFSPQKGTVSSSAFMPPKPKEPVPADFVPELSVNRIENLHPDKIWSKGGEIGKKRGITLKARADFKAIAVTDAGLSSKPDPWPSRHVNLIGWPSHTNKAEQMQIANKLALASTLAVC